MHNDLNDIFDQEIRSMMEDAEVKVPSRVWSAIDSSLGHKKAAPLWWRAAGLSVAFAAAALAAVVIINREPQAALLQEPSSEYVAEIIPQQVAAAPVVDVVVEKSEEKVQEVEMVKEAEPVQEVVELKQVSEAEQEFEPVSEQEIEQVSEQVSETQPYVDPFALMAYEDLKAKSKNKTLVSIGGMAGANDNIKTTVVHNGIFGASGNGVLEDMKEGIIESSESVYSIPVSFGINFRKYISERFSLGSGLNYTLLNRKFQGIYYNVSSHASHDSGIKEIRHSIQYVGVPINVYYDILSGDLVKFYAQAGVEAEKAISNKYYDIESNNFLYGEKVNNLQFSTSIGIGLQLDISDRVGLYLDPGVRYYFDCNQPKSIRTQKPFMFNMVMGLRFEFK